MRHAPLLLALVLVSCATAPAVVTAPSTPAPEPTPASLRQAQLREWAAAVAADPEAYGDDFVTVVQGTCKLLHDMDAALPEGACE